MNRKQSWLMLAAAGLVLAVTQQSSLAQGYGHVTGQFVLKGEIPDLGPIPVGEKDANVCKVNPPLPNNRLIVDPKTKGIKNIVVYLKKAPEKIHPALRNSKDKEIVFDQKTCRFKPHVLLVRTDQTVVVKNDDPINHNTHTHTFRNQQQNFLLKPNDREGVEVPCPQPEFLPMPVKCDLHPHMKAYWMILDHPYMAKTDSEGKFKIENLPAGDYDFTVWHEEVGYLDKEFEVSIFADSTDEKGKISVPVDKFKLD